MRYWWPWVPSQRPTFTAGSTGDTREIGLCEKCDTHAMIFLNGQRLLCWDHYCAETRLLQQSEPK